MKTQSIQYAIALSRYLVIRNAIKESFNNAEVLNQLKELLNQAIAASEVAKNIFSEMSLEERARDAVSIAKCLYIPFTKFEALINLKGSKTIRWPGGAECFNVVFPEISGNEFTKSKRIEDTDSFVIFSGGKPELTVHVIDCLEVVTYA